MNVSGLLYGSSPEDTSQQVQSKLKSTNLQTLLRWAEDLVIQILRHVGTPKHFKWASEPVSKWASE